MMIMRKKMKTLSIGTITACIGCIILMVGCKGSGSENNAANADSAKQAASAQPVPGAPIKYDSSKRYIYLTWDDSPQPPGTQICKGIFLSEGVKATFFSVGMNAFDTRRKRMIDTIR